MTVIDLRKQKSLDADPKAMKWIDFTGKLVKAGNTTIFFITEEAKERFFVKISETIVNVFYNLFCFKMKWFNITLWM